MEDLLLMIETSGPYCSVAVAQLLAGEWTLVGEEPGVRGAATAPQAAPQEPMSHTALLLPMIKDLLPADGFERLRAVACSSGPGSYTALRAGLSSAKGICLALEKPLVQASTLRGLAAAGRAGSTPSGEAACYLLAVVPARRQEVYAAIYDADTLAERGAPGVYENTESWRQSLLTQGVTHVCSPAAAVLESFGESRLPTRLVPLTASNLLTECVLRIKNNAFDALGSTAPLYLRPPHITKPKTSL